MGRESSITFAQVAEAANNIKVKGENPTVRNVRDLLGKGSNNTVIKFLNEWVNQQDVNAQQFIEPLLDSTITRALNTLIQTKVIETTAKITAQLNERQTECNMLITENSYLTNEVESQASELSVKKERNAELLGRIQQFEVDAARTAATLTTERQNAETARLSLCKAEMRLELIPHLEDEIKRMREELKEANSLTANYRESAAVAKAKLESESHHHPYVLADQTKCEASKDQKKIVTSKAHIF